jgi:hypothetical protein
VERTTIAGETEVLGENLPQRHFVQLQIPQESALLIVEWNGLEGSNFVVVVVVGVVVVVDDDDDDDCAWFLGLG